MQAVFNKPGSESSKKLTPWIERINKIEAAARVFNWLLLSEPLNSLASEVPRAAEAILVFNTRNSLPLGPDFQASVRENLKKEYKKANADRKWEIYNKFKKQGWGKPY